MNKEFIPYEQALELKRLGFDEPCFGWFTNSYLRIGSVIENKHVQGEDEILAPLYQQAFRWFREKYELSSWVYNSHMDKYFYTILQDGRIVKATESATTYEEAELECLKKLIEIVRR